MATTNSTPEQTSRQIGKMTLTLPSDREIVLTRTFDAPRRLVWEAFTKPEHVRHWWGLRGSTMTSCDMDFRPGGSWRFVLREADGNEYAFRGEIREIVPPERIVQTFEFEGMPGAVSVESLTLAEHGGKTTITATSTFDSIEGRDGMLQSGMERGAAETYDRLEEHLRTIA
ncbi:MAG TPA: SRPBCC family protein [Chloroflexota bacterium]|jgi:uncharacterized protein YndB with AHSA1/START domain|nr:SRPBCC family protein [Chloroflexota bacterium]